MNSTGKGLFSVTWLVKATPKLIISRHRFADDSLKQCLWELTIDNAGITANANYAM